VFGEEFLLPQIYLQSGFLHLSDNKTELFKLLSQEAIKVQISDGKLYMELMKVMLCVPRLVDLNNLAPCYHEEADTRYFSILLMA